MTDEIKERIRNRLISLGINSNDDVDDIFKRWSEPHRFYHGMNHLNELIERLIENNEWDNDKLFLTIIFHDIIYKPNKTYNPERPYFDTNESNSAGYYMNKMVRNCFDDVCCCIIDTQNGIPQSPLSEKFIMEYDRYNLYFGSFTEILKNTKLLFKEQQFIDVLKWKVKIIEFLNQYVDINKNIKNVIEYVLNWTPNIGVYAGTFGPFHKGHYNILEKAEKIFDKVIIARGVNPEKSKNEYELPKILEYHQIEYFNGFLTTFMDKLGYDTTLIRGLRNSTDLQYEMTQFQYLQDMKPDIKIINIFCDKQYEHISSSAIRNLMKLDPETVKKYLL